MVSSPDRRALPQLLYKYVTADRALTCLPEVGDGALRATQPGALNDPFECHVVKIFVEKDVSEGDAEFASILTKLHELAPVTPVDVAEARRVYGSLYMRELLARQLSLRFGIVSFAAVPFDPLMWSHYTGDGSGFVIGYETECLRSLAGAGERLREVRYSSEPPLLTGYVVALEPEGNRYVLLCVKSSHWEHEKEWRLIVELDRTVGTGTRDRHGQPINLVRIANSAVAKVYYTERTPVESVDEIKRRLAAGNNRYGVKEPTKLVLSERTYGYEKAVTEEGLEAR